MATAPDAPRLLLEFGASNPAPAAILRVKAGVKSDGTFLALKGDVIFDAGAECGRPPARTVDRIAGRTGLLQNASQSSARIA